MNECKPLKEGGDEQVAVEGALQRLQGRAVQVDPIKPKLTPPGTKRFNLKCDILLSNYTSKFNLCRDIKAFHENRETAQKLRRGMAFFVNATMVRCFQSWVNFAVESGEDRERIQKALRKFVMAATARPGRYCPPRHPSRAEHSLLTQHATHDAAKTIWPGRYCPPRHPSHVEASLLKPHSTHDVASSAWQILSATSSIACWTLVINHTLPCHDVASNIWQAFSEGGGVPAVGGVHGGVHPAQGRAVQVDPIKTTLKAPGMFRLKPKYDEV